MTHETLTDSLLTTTSGMFSLGICIFVAVFLLACTCKFGRLYEDLMCMGGRKKGSGTGKNAPGGRFERDSEK